MHRLAAGLVVLTLSAMPAAGQARKSAPPAPRKPPTPAASLKKEAPEITCPTPLGVGVTTKVSYCDVMTGREPAAGVLIKLPPHRGPLTLTFDLYNRHTYSEEEVKAKRAYRRYTATIGVLTMDNTLVSRAVVQNEFRTAADLIDRIGGGAGPGGVKAVAPTGRESIMMMIPEGEDQISILGEKLTVERPEETATYTQPGRPIAIISDVMIEYKPGPTKPVRKPPAPRK